jgi:PTH1 family peptidyl-tRNA hydrolase
MRDFVKLLRERFEGLVGRTSPLECSGVKAIVGLGNPGGKYERTRHNAGFLVLDRLAEKHGWRFNQKRDRSLVARGRLDQVEVVLAKPQTYMNLSGQAVQRLLASHGVKVEDLLVVYDDFDLPLGRLRLREQGGPGTHNGMRSIAALLGSTAFPRLRIGIGSAEPGAARDHVLGDFDPADWEAFEAVRERAVEAIETYLRDGLAAAMNRFNG